MSPSPSSPPPAWRRESAGAYASSDGRFRIEGDGAGRWFIRDTEERDELGLERTIGPFATLDEAKADATVRRDRPAEASPLQERLARAPRRGPPAERPPAKRTAPARPRSWLDRLAAADARSATRARRWIADLERLGIADAEAVVRRDIEADEPAVAARLLERAIREAAARALRGADGEPDEASIALTARVADAIVEAVADRERTEDADRDLPGWRLVEHDPGDAGRARRIRIAADTDRRSG